MASNIDYKNISPYKIPLLLLTHPVEAYEEMRWNKKGSLLVANLILVCFFFATIASQQYTGFIFNRYRPEYLNIFSVFTITVGLFALWLIGNMAICTLTDGEGTFIDVWVNTAYALVPYIIFLLIATLVSNFIVMEEGVFYQLITGAGLLWTAMLLFLGLKTAHQFTLAKTITSVLLTLLAMVIIVFMILLTFSLIQQVVQFVTTVYDEIRFRM